MQSQQSTPTAHALQAAGEYLTFRLGDEEYGIPILKVQEIRGYEKPTRIANSPSYMKGVINLRGVIVPIIDLRLRLALAAVDYGPLTVVIILNIGSRVVGIVVDSVSDVLQLDASQVRPAPEMHTSLAEGCITGLGAVDERMLILLEIEHLVSSPEMALAG